jgi:transcriptional regulator with XRE-family HTH domain
MKQPELGKRIADLRKEKGLTQDELVRLCNLSIRTLQRIESGEVLPRSYTVKSIFKALDYSPDNLDFATSVASEIDDTPTASFQGFKQVYMHVVDIFNLKTNTMKKLTILSVFCLLIVFLVSNRNANAQSNNANPLVGKWELESISAKAFNSQDSTMQTIKISINKTSTRYLEFRPDNTFETRTIQNEIYNAGAYSLLNDSLFVTVHFELNGKLNDVSNLYGFKMRKDTLHFYGYYLDKTTCAGEKACIKKYIDEWWVRSKDSKSKQ